MTITRRTLLHTASALSILPLAGCVGNRSDTSEDDPEEGDGSSSAQNNDPKDTSGDQEPNSADPGTESDSESEQSQDEDEEDEDEEERQQKPDEEDTEIDREQYEDQEGEEHEVAERSADDIEIEDDASIDDNGTATVSGTVTNVSDEPIGVVDLEIVFYGADDQYLTAKLESLTDIEPDASAEFETSVTPEEARGEPQRYEITPDVYDIA